MNIESVLSHYHTYFHLNRHFCLAHYHKTSYIHFLAHWLTGSNLPHRNFCPEHSSLNLSLLDLRKTSRVLAIQIPS